MNRPYNERRNRQVFILVDRRKMPPKDIPEYMEKKFNIFITYDNVRKIISLFRKIHKNSQSMS